MQIKPYDNISDFVNSNYDPSVVGNNHFILRLNGEKIILINRKNDKNFIELPMYKLNDGYGYIGPNTSYLIRLIDHSNGYIRPFEKFGKQAKKIELFPQLIVIHE